MKITFKISPLLYHAPKLWVAILSSVLFSCGTANEVTYYSDIEPIVFKNCTPCHSDGGGAPFSLLSFKDVKKRAKTIAFITREKVMPPWPADKSYSHFLNERGLSEDEIAIIQEWYKQGAKEGTNANRAKPKADTRIPDLVLAVPNIPIKGNNKDAFYVAKVPYEIAQDTFVEYVEFISGKANVVHHANGHLLNYDKENKKDVFAGNNLLNTDLEESAFFANFEALQLLQDDGSKPSRVHSAVNYLPGMEYYGYPHELGGFNLNKKGAFVLNDIHYGPFPYDTIDSSYLHVYFMKSKPKRPFQEIMLGTNGVSKIEPPLLVPAGETKTFTTKWTAPIDVSFVSLNPHMHLLGQSIEAFAVKPNGDTIPLIKIPRWDFRWQFVYSFEKLLKIPKGTVITVKATFNNTAKNKNNPYNPPRDIGERLDKNGASMRTTDEMLQFIIMAIPYKKGDENISLKGT